MGFCINRELEGLVDKISTVNKIGCFLGAGTSMSLGMPGIVSLTTDVINNLKIDAKISVLRNQIEDEKKQRGYSNTDATIEDLLNKIRIIRELTNDNADYTFSNITGQEAKKLDIDICKEIYSILSEKQFEAKDKMEIPLKFSSWLNNLNVSGTKEVFTSNYDLILEMAMEKLYIPYFDGFVGAYKPFFLQESVETSHSYCVSNDWIRLWKIHGSLGWFWEVEENGHRIVRLGETDLSKIENELVIYPSKEKYNESRKQPFISYFDRMRNFLVESECLLIITGYSFGDEHINETFYEAMTRNNRLHIVVFLYADTFLENTKSKAVLYPNLTLISPTKAVIGGKYDNWIFDEEKLKENEFQNYCDDKLTENRLGDFKTLVDFFVENTGKKREIEKEVEQHSGQ